MNISALGIDLAKTIFSLHGVDVYGKTVLCKTVSRTKLLPFLSTLPRCKVGMEACSGAHHFARCLEKMGFEVRLMAAKFVAPYRKGGKNDGNDAEAICEALTRPNMRFVSIKHEDQQALLSLHRIRESRVRERTALINQLRGLLSEFGLVMPKGRHQAQQQIPRLLEDAENGLPWLVRDLLHDEYQRLLQLNEQLKNYDKQIEQLSAQNEAMKRMMTLPGVGAITATALFASIGDIKNFKSGRELAAWLGLVPKQYSTGGKPRLGRITKHGDKYLRTLLIHGTRSVMNVLGDKQDHLSQWLRSVIDRRGKKKAAVALAAKHARIIWAMLSRGETYQIKTASLVVS